MEMNEKKEARIRAINQRIRRLEEHQVMWARAGGAGERMVMESLEEISDLKLERDDLLTGSHNLEIRKLGEKYVN